MPETSPLVYETIGDSDSPAPAAVPVETSPTAGEMDILNDEVMIRAAPDRPTGTIRVKLIYAGRSTPIPAEDPWAE
jgi:hypothetical protein